MKLTAREKDVKKSLKEYLKAIGAYQYWPVPMGYGSTSVDCFFCYQGKFFAVETKRSDVSTPTDRQGQVLRDVAAAGGGQCLENDPALPAVRAMVTKTMGIRRGDYIGDARLLNDMYGGADD
jgi:hypothetical protein